MACIFFKEKKMLKLRQLWIFAEKVDKNGNVGDNVLGLKFSNT